MVVNRWNDPIEQHSFEARLRAMAPIVRDNLVPLIRIDGPYESAVAGATRARSASGEFELDIDASRRQRIDSIDGPIWVEGNTILCSCPDCAAPISLRLNLAMANCWRCESCVELSPAQRRAVEVAMRTATTIDEREGTPADRAQTGSSVQARSARRRDRSVGLAPNFEIGPRRRRRSIRERIHSIPAWLVSMLFHLLLLMILALILMPHESLDETITITTFIDPVDQPGGEIAAMNIENQLGDDLLPAPLLEMGDAELRQFKLLADQDARLLQIDEAPFATLPDVASVRRNLTTETGQTRSLAARDPRVRADIVTKEGGSNLTEAAVSRGLRWLATVQNKDGSWSLTDYDQSHRPRNQGDVAGTALALLPFLGAGQTHEFGVYKSNVAKGLQWLIDQQKSSGDLRDALNKEYGMYAHGQASIVLIEAYSMTGDEKLREPAQRAIRFIENAQHERGGWRYQPHEEGDTSVFGWQLMALQSARASGSSLQVDDATLKLADYFLDLVSRRVSPRELREIKERFRQPGVLYRYQPGREPTSPMTAEAILCRMYLGWQKDDPRLIAAVDWLTQYHLPDADSEFNVYYWYYAMQSMHHYGGSKWKTWNRRIRDLLTVSQESRGKYPGSWDPDNDVWGRRAGRIYVTSLAVCTLEVYYRHLPLFKKLDLTSNANAE